MQVAAIKALGSLGGRDDLKLLVQSLSADSEPIREAARTSLIQLPTDVSIAMVAELKESPTSTRIALLQILTVSPSEGSVARDAGGSQR